MSVFLYSLQVQKQRSNPMAPTASSSKRKSSNKKTSKISSQVSRKKKIRRNKSKKRRGGDDSNSFSDDGSTSSMSVSYSSAEDEYKSRKGRSRVRSSVKSKKRIARRRSSSREGSKDSTRLRKRKRSKKNGDSKLRKKGQKKRHKRHDSIGSKSSDSTDRGGSNSSGEESDFERLRGRSRDKKGKGDSGKRKSGIKKSKNRSRSGENRDNYDTENVDGEINTRRLRSVITVTKEPSEREEDEQDRDEHTEEIVYDHDDYPSCRSNDTNDGGNKELVDQSRVESEKRRRVENVTREEAFVLDLATNESVVSVEDGNNQYDGLIPYPDRFRTNSPEKEHESEAPTIVAGSGHDGDDMELILRQKALENLKKFRGGLKANPKTHGDVENESDVSVKQVSSANAECVQSKSPKKDPKIPMLRNDSFHPTRAEGKIPVGRFGETESGAAKESVVRPPDKVIISRGLKDKDHASPHAVSNKSESNRSTMKHEFLGTSSTPKQEPMSLASPRAAVSVTKSIVNNSVAETSQTAAVIRSDNNSIGVLDASQSAAAEPPSSVKPTSEEHNSSRERQDEAKDSSQFEQKTMTVMRGGELVQVNYKVYIPKKAPALARRKLQR